MLMKAGIAGFRGPSTRDTHAPMCGHATVGAVWLLAKLGKLRSDRVAISTRSGRVEARVEPDQRIADMIEDGLFDSAQEGRDDRRIAQGQQRIGFRRGEPSIEPMAV